MKIAPTRTWVPWKPVVTKNLEPKELSLKEKFLILYSKYCTKVKKKPKKIVNKKKIFLSLLVNKLWWAHVIVRPLVNRILVFKRGIWKGSRERIEKGGQVEPISFEGVKLLWKKAQNHPKKNIISLKINKIILILRLVLTSKE